MACEYSCEWGHCFTGAKAKELGYVCDKSDGTPLTPDGGDVMMLSRETLVELAHAETTTVHTKKALLKLADGRSRKKGKKASRKPAVAPGGRARRPLKKGRRT